MSSACDAAFCFGDYTLDLRRGCLRASGRREIALRPKSFKLLCHLVENAGRLVPKDELIAVTWPGATAVADDSVSRCVSDVRLALADSGRRMVRTVSGRGYLFAEPVAVRSAVRGPPEPVGAGGRVPEAADEQDAGAAVPDGTGMQAPASPRLSLVVLPFANLGGNPAEDYLADIITDGLTVHLSRVAGSSVIARSTASAYKGCALDVRRIGRELGVRYALEGSEQHDEACLRVSARLIDTRIGTHLWADQFDADRTDPLRMQQAVVTRLARALHVELLAVEAVRVPRAAGGLASSEDLALRGEAMLVRLGAPRGDEAETGYDLCGRALELDPGNARALSILAERYATRVTTLQSVDRDDDTRRADELSSRAIASAPRSYYAHHARARVLVAQMRPVEAVAEAERSLSLNPSFTPAYLNLCQASLHLIRPEETLAHAETALRLSPPLDPYVSFFHAIRGFARFMLRDDDRAIGCLQQALPGFPRVGFWLAGTLALTGQEEQARDALRRYLALRGTKTRTISQLRSLGAADSPAYFAFRERLYNGLRRAGMSER